jgi:polyisoprenoid-binding protein YceI
MSVTDISLNTSGLPLGTWSLDPTHSSASFAVKHMAVHSAALLSVWG